MIVLADALAAHAVCSLPALGLLPLPVWGEGWGEGVRKLSMDLNPSPHPSPYGEREQTELVALALAKSLAFIR
jgi:hypothetical protein